MTTFRTLRHPRVLALLLGASIFGSGNTMAQTVFGDVVAKGSLCVGFDCPDKPNFGFDTIILRENNLRIFFDDTSVSTFPKNKWRVTVNSDASGGASFFAIDDVTATKQPFRISAGARGNSIFVDPTGNVGFGTATPALTTHARNGNTPGLRLEQDTSSGWPAQTWDVAGNEANFFVRDLTGGSRLPFRIRPGAPTSSVDIAASGNVGFGTASPGFRLHAVDTNATIAKLETNAAAGFIQQKNVDSDWFIGPTNGNTPQGWGLFSITAAQYRIAIDGSGNVGMGVTAPTAKLDVNGTVRVATLGANPPGNTMCFSAANVLGSCSSDARLKHNVRYLQESAGLDAVMKLKPATFQWQDGDERVMAGFIAHETQAAIPEAVHKPAGSEYLSLDSAAVLSYAVRAIQELKTDNDRLRADIERLKASR